MPGRDRRHWVVTGLAERVATAQPSRRQPAAAQRAVSPQGFEGVARTSRVKPAGPRFHRADDASVEPNREREQPGERGADHRRRRPLPRGAGLWKAFSTSFGSSPRSSASGRSSGRRLGISTTSQLCGIRARSNRKASRRTRLSLLRRTAPPWSLLTDTPSRGASTSPSRLGQTTTVTQSPAARRPRP